MSQFEDLFKNTIDPMLLSGLGSDALWIKQNGGSKNIHVEFSNESLRDELGGVIDIQQPMAACLKSAVVGIKINDVLAVQDEQYIVVSIHARHDGWIDLMLRVM